MVQKRFLDALVLLLSIVASVSADKQGRTALEFGDWLGKQVKSTAASKAGPSFAAPGYEYDSIEVRHTCLEGIAFRNCRDDESYQYFESVLGCCGGEHHGKELVLKPNAIGQCDFTVFNLILLLQPNLAKLGTFVALCHFDKKADECGEPFCDKMVLNVQGDVYAIGDAIVSSNPGLSADDCFARRKAAGNITEHLSGVLFPTLAAKHASRKSPEVTAKAAYKPDQEGYRQHEGADYYHSSRTLYKTKQAQVFYGPFTVNSRSHSVKYDQGWMQSVLYYDVSDTVPITEDEAGDAHVLDPYKYKLSFYKKQSY